MGRHEIGDEELLHAEPGVHLRVSFQKFFGHGARRLAHILQHLRAHMFGGHLQLSADVPAAEFLEKFALFIRDDVVVAKPRADEYLFDARQSAYLAQQRDVIVVVRAQLFAGLRIEAGLSLAGAALD